MMADAKGSETRANRERKRDKERGEIGNEREEEVQN